MAVNDEASDDRTDAEFELWHVYDAGGPALNLKVRYHDDVELADWRDGADLFTALRAAESQGWHAFDREPGDAPGEYAIFHMKRDVRPGRRHPD